MRWTRYALIILVLLALWGVLELYKQSMGNPNRGPHGIELIVPPEYRVLEMGKARVSDAARVLEAALMDGDRSPVAAVFEQDGDLYQVLVDPAAEIIDERFVRASGTANRVIWRESVDERLAFATLNGHFALPDAPPPERRNLYH